VVEWCKEVKRRRTLQNDPNKGGAVEGVLLFFTIASVIDGEW